MNKYIHPIQLGTMTQRATSRVQKQGSELFQRMLERASEVKVSKHAQQRLAERNIHVPEQKWQQLNEKMVEANEKGVTDALVMMGDVALVVSTKNKTVVTAIHQEEAMNKIFTNINGTIIL
ncbi:MAG TPA: TIGR02530 family flagellar biosynthesis protein [Pseudogracilibacillus sp.]|nr:TIGR02530 family flagellar biosynthesis protein [Pseudogracilibacillus sp.]